MSSRFKTACLMEAAAKTAFGVNSDQAGASCCGGGVGAAAAGEWCFSNNRGVKSPFIPLMVVLREEEEEAIDK